jgi:hypothetical protein
MATLSHSTSLSQRSSRYLPQHQSVSTTPSPYPDPNTLLTLLPAFSYAPQPYPTTSAALKSSQYSPFHSSIRSAHPSHRRALCATLHPNEPNCYKNFGHAVWEAWPGSAALVGGYSAVVMLAKARASVVKQSVPVVISKWKRPSADFHAPVHEPPSRNGLNRPLAVLASSVSPSVPHG